MMHRTKITRNLIVLVAGLVITTIAVAALAGHDGEDAHRQFERGKRLRPKC